MVDKMGAWIGVISSAVTIGLTLYNAQLNADALKRQQELTTLEANLKARAQELEVSRERTSRYQFVNQLLPDLLKENKGQVTLTTNLITLALTAEEAQKLFSGLEASTETTVAEAGKLGTESVKAQELNLSRTAQAQALETAGFDALLKGDFETALVKFEETEKVYPSFHQAYEIGLLLRKNKDGFSDSATQKRILTQIATEMSYGAPTETIQKLKEMGK